MLNVGDWSACKVLQGMLQLDRASVFFATPTNGRADAKCLDGLIYFYLFLFFVFFTRERLGCCSSAFGASINTSCVPLQKVRDAVDGDG